ncbi:hypothetical protein [Aquibium oceanicum]|uniref:Uncharacterized protein n=1 Tax=Aquibium oceanicum TaxID=1670800 RepID=A0A1L3SNY8_9HYPH|nr:hypothetical protein [Aquibium oceanicum]APH71114.1 hypothetical protein BSQ44_06825 [Aquibium oceanicum]
MNTKHEPDLTEEQLTQILDNLSQEDKDILQCFAQLTLGEFKLLHDASHSIPDFRQRVRSFFNDDLTRKEV